MSLSISGLVAIFLGILGSLPAATCRRSPGRPPLLLGSPSRRSAYFEKALSNGSLSEFIDQLDAAGALDDDSKRKAYMAERAAMDRAIIDKLAQPQPSPLGSRDDASPKVAFIFMTKSEVYWPSLWAKFFEAAPREKYSIYMHQGSVTDDKVVQPFSALAQFGAVRVPTMPNKWCALFGVEASLLQRALENNDNQQFVFISESTIPVKGFDHVHQQLAGKTPSTSKFCLASQAQTVNAGTQALKDELLHGCTFRDFYSNEDTRTRKHHQWIVLSRKHAQAVVQQASPALDLYEQSWQKAAPDIRQSGDGCSDEAAPLTSLLLDIEKAGKSTGDPLQDMKQNGIEQECLTFAHWRHCLSGSLLNLDGGVLHNISVFWKHRGELWKLATHDENYDIIGSPLREELNGFPRVFYEVDEPYLRKLVDTSFMFARKFPTNAKVKGADGSSKTLDEVLPQLWEEHSKSGKTHSTWSTLETSGQLS